MNLLIVIKFASSFSHERLNVLALILIKLLFKSRSVFVMNIEGFLLKREKKSKKTSDIVNYFVI